MLEIDVLASGSSGNSYLLSMDDSAIFVDVGVCKRDLLKAKKRLEGKKVSLFLTHEHIDHIKGFKYFQSIFGGDIFCGFATAKYLHQMGYDTENIKVIEHNHTYTFDGWEVFTFGLSHDSADIFGFRFNIEGYKVSFVTDTGEINRDILDAISKTNILFLESNYEDEMLKKGRYPVHLKKRILSRKGHLSNRDAINTLHEIYDHSLEKVCFSHISEENNSYDLMDKYCKYCEKTFKIDTIYLKQKTSYSFKVH